MYLIAEPDPHHILLKVQLVCYGSNLLSTGPANTKEDTEYRI
jgi:hypothetical protein